MLLQDVLDSLQAKLGLKAMSHFSLVVEHVKSLKRNKLTLLNPRDTLAKVSLKILLKLVQATSKFPAKFQVDKQMDALCKYQN